VADLEADRLRALMRATVFGQPLQPVTIDRYEIVKLLGSGAMGLVYEVFDPKRGEQVALKTLRGQSPRALSLFKREFRALSRITHPNLVALYELGRDEYQFFFTMELVRGSALLRYLWGGEPAPAPVPGELPLSPVADFARLRGVFAQLAEGVHALHQAHKLHRDIKPTNVMVTPQGRVVLMDFGFVGEQTISNLDSTAGSMIVGTPAYMAPEQASGGPRDASADWYSVGATLYVALTGQVPFHGENLAVMMERKQSQAPPPPRSLAAGIPEDLDALCVALLQPDPKARLTGAEVLAALHTGSEPALARGAPYLSPAATHVGARRFIGRADAVAALRRAYADVCTSGRPVAVLVRGRAGIGKSALVRHVTDELRHTATVLRARCYERDGVPLKALDSLMDALARHLRQHPRPELAPAIATLAPLFPVLQPGEEPVAGAPPRRAGEIDRASFAALRQLLARLSTPRPSVLWIDDFQWGDPGSVYALQRLLRPPDPPPTLLIASYRSEDSDTSPALHALVALSETPGVAVQELDVGPLDAGEVHALAEAVLGSDTAPARLRKLAAEAQGSPQFLHDLARFVAHGPGAAPEVTLDELLEIRLARLGPAPRRLLEVVAVAGRPIAMTPALRAADALADSRAIVQQLLGMGLLRSLSAADGDRLDTYHERTRELALAHLDGAALREVHAALAAALAADPDPDPELLARHYRGAGDLPRARQYAAAAALAARDARAWTRAADLYRVAAELGPRPEDAAAFHLQRADALARAGRSPAAAEAYLSARTGSSGPDALALTAQAAVHLLSAGHLEAGRALLVEGFAAAGLARPAATVRGKLAALWRRGQMAVRGSQWTERPAAAIPALELARVDLRWAAAIGELAVDPALAADVQAQHLLLALRTGEPLRVARALVVDAALAAHLGPAARARMELQLADARRILARHDDAHLGLLAELVELAAAGLGGDVALAHARAEALARQLAAGDGLALPWARAAFDHHACRALLLLGRWSALQTRLPGLLAGARERDDRSAQVWMHGLAAWMRLAAGDPSGAAADLAAAEAAWPHAPAQGYHLQHLQIAQARTHLLLYTGDPARAWASLQEDASSLARSGLPQCPALHSLALDLEARAALAAWRARPGLSAARKAAQRAADDLHTLGLRGHADLVRAGLDAARSGELLASASAEFAARGFAAHHAVARLRLGDPSGAAALAAEGVQDPARVAAVLAP
jgi:hypothetical protein